MRSTRTTPSNVSPWRSRPAAEPRNNADYRDIIRASLMVDADYLVMAMMLRYKAGERMVTKSYEATANRIDAIYASDRLRLPLKGILLIGY